jgi:hypothetical protein
MSWEDRPKHFMAFTSIGSHINGAPLVGYFVLVIVSSLILGLYLKVKTEIDTNSGSADSEGSNSKPKIQSVRTLRAMGTEGRRWLRSSRRTRTGLVEARLEKQKEGSGSSEIPL